VLHRLSPGFYVGSLLVVGLGQMLYAFRWRVVLGGMGIAVPYGEVLRQYLIGVFFSNLMPTAVGGDAAKVYYLGRRFGYVPIGASVFLDRFLGFLWLAVLGATLAWMARADSALLMLNRNLLTMFALAFVATVIVARLAPVEALLGRIVPTRWAPFAARVAEFVALVRSGACRPATLGLAGGVVITYAWLITVVYQQYFIASGLPAVATLPAMLVIVSMSIFVNVPISVNGIGLREQLHVLLFTGLGIPKEVSVGISLLLFSYFLVLSLVGGGLWLRTRSAAIVPAV
jgi:glycosyltransferase 2 family protein